MKRMKVSRYHLSLCVQNLFWEAPGGRFGWVSSLVKRVWTRADCSVKKKILIEFQIHTNRLIAQEWVYTMDKAHMDSKIQLGAVLVHGIISSVLHSSYSYQALDE